MTWTLFTFDAAGEYVESPIVASKSTDFGNTWSPTIRVSPPLTGFSGGSPRRVLLFWHALGNQLLTTLSNAFTVNPPNTTCTGRRGSTPVMLVHSAIMAIPAASQNRANSQPPR